MHTKCNEQQPHINNHFSHNLATTTATSTKTSSSNSDGLVKDFNNQQQQPTIYINKTNKTKRLSVLSTKLPKQQQQQQLYQQPKQHHYLTQQQCQQLALLRKSPRPHYSLTLNNKYAFATTTTATAPNPPSQHPTSTTATRNSLNSYEFTHLKDCDLDHMNDDYYLPSSIEILGIQKSLEHDKDLEHDAVSSDLKTNNRDNINNAVVKTTSEKDNNLEEKQENYENELVVELDNKTLKRLSANLNDLEIAKNATNNLLKQQQTNRLWDH